MQNKKILRYTFNSSVKNILGFRYRNIVEAAWALNLKDYYKVQESLFRITYDYARAKVPYYKNRRDYYPEYNGDNFMGGFLQSLPIVDKKVFKNEPLSFVSSGAMRWCTAHTTSGTTGTPVRIYATPFERSLTNEILNSWYKKISGQKKVPPIISLSGFMTPERDGELCWSAFGGKHLFLNMYSLDDKNIQKIISIFQKYKNGIIFGYASALAELSRVVNDKMLDIKNNFIAVSTSEILTPNYRSLVNSNICNLIYDQYGSQEGCHLALECHNGHLHVHPYIGSVEILDENNNSCSHGELGRVVITGFKKSMPLIRYDIGDYAVALNESCDCGISWPVIGGIVGRSEDLVITPDGRRVGYLNFHSTKNLNGILESQLIQNGYLDFVFRIVLEPGTHESAEIVAINEKLIVGELNTRIGYDVNVKFEYLDRIPRSGGRNKFSAVVVNFEHKE